MQAKCTDVRSTSRNSTVYKSSCHSMAGGTAYVARTDTVNAAFDAEEGNAESVADGQTGPSNCVTDVAGSDDIAEEIEIKKRQMSPLRYCRLIADNPKLAFGKFLPDTVGSSKVAMTDPPATCVHRCHGLILQTVSVGPLRVAHALTLFVSFTKP